MMQSTDNPATGSARSDRWAGPITPAVRDAITLAAIIGFAALFLQPLLRSGCYGDDRLAAQIGGFMQLDGCTLSEFVTEHMPDWLIREHLFPVQEVFRCASHYFLQDELELKLFALVMIVANVPLVYLLLRGFGLERALAQLGALGFVLLLQMRNVDDPILSQTGLMPLLASELLAAFVCFQRFRASRQPAWLAVGLAAYGLTLATHAMAYLLLPVFAVLAYAYERRLRAALAAVWPMGVVLLMIVAYYAGMCYHAEFCNVASYLPTNWPAQDPAAMGLAEAEQAAAALPLSYPLFGAPGKMRSICADCCAVARPCFWGFWRLH